MTVVRGHTRIHLATVITDTSCHGIFYAIVVWHDVLQRERKKAKGTDKEWGVKSIKKRREDEHEQKNRVSRRMGR